MLKKFYLINLSLLLVSLLSVGCTAPPDFPVCIELDITRGRCVYVISGKEIKVNDKEKLEWIDDKGKKESKTWWDLRPSMVLVPAHSWAQLKKYIIKNCKKTGKCDKEITNWERTVETIDKTFVR